MKRSQIIVFFAMLIGAYSVTSYCCHWFPFDSKNKTVASIDATDTTQATVSLPDTAYVVQHEDTLTVMITANGKHFEVNVSALVNNKNVKVSLNDGDTAEENCHCD